MFRSRSIDLPLISTVRCLSWGMAILALAAQAVPAQADLARYELTFESTWTAETHPVDFPGGAHFSGHLGATHNENFSLWQPGELASPGIKEIAERGVITPLDQEVDAGLADGSAFKTVQLGGLGTTPGSRQASFQVNATHPLISFATMIAPSPDWIVGVHDVSLMEDGLWLPEIKLDAIPYDAGTDSGVTFSSGNQATSPFEPISRIVDAPFEDSPPLGHYTLKLLTTPGDVNGSGAVDAEDLSAFCFRLGQTNEQYEFTGDDTVTVDDLAFVVERILDTRPGDANLDGQVAFDDFLALSQNFGQGNANWNSGDFDCSRSVDFADFLALSQNFGFSNVDSGPDSGVASAAAVPEPAGLLSALWLVLLVFSPVRRTLRSTQR